MKTRFHRWMLGIMILLLMPGTLVACLILIGGVGDGIRQGFRASSELAMIVCAIPPVLVFWGFRMLPELGQGVHATLRRRLLAFYLVVLVYCMAWLFSSASRHGDEFAIFPNEIRIFGSMVLILPVLITLFTSPEVRREWDPQSEAVIRPNRPGDRFVSWLASRIR